MDKGKIKIDLSNYLNNDIKTDFAGYQPKILEAINKLYNSKDQMEAMTGWLNLPHDKKMYKNIAETSKKTLDEKKYEHLLVIGIGGSSLGAQALLEGLNTPLWSRLSKGKRKGALTIDFIDNLDPQIIRTVLSRLKLNKTLFLIISKGGGTLETIVPMLIAKEWIEEDFYKQCIFVTTEGKGLLYKLGNEKNIPMFYIPENVGGRYSVFSPVGLLPASLCGLDILEIQKGIEDADNLCREVNLKTNIAAIIALSAYFSYASGKNIFVLMPYSTCLKRFVDWFVQLWAESLGKNTKGSTPLSAIGATDQHSQIQMFNEGPNDKLICFLKINKHKRDLVVPDFSFESEELKLYANHKVGKILNLELDATRKALGERKRPNILITMPELNEYFLSQVMYHLEFATVLMGNLLGINPFDQPGVELAKKYTKEALS
ncbi:MAG: glucose-6-phosphate isomerase [Candidatus Melainabacteria bacterium]|nr:glucose-6-phosphate isomerase [Candidatus Melainabacteria bacterium]